MSNMEEYCIKKNQRRIKWEDHLYEKNEKALNWKISSVIPKKDDTELFGISMKRYMKLIYQAASLEKKAFSWEEWMSSLLEGEWADS